MSGHSKWSTIKRQKGAQDQKRGQIFTKLSSAITLAVRQGGGIGDPAQNFRLRLAVESAKAANVPKENIDRAIKRAEGKDAERFEEVIYEGFAPFGVSLVVEAATDNSARTTAEIKSFFSKEGGTFARPGAVSYLFKPVGEIVLPATYDFDRVFAAAAEAEAEDVEGKDAGIVVETSIENLANVKRKLEDAGLIPESTEITRKAISKVRLGNEETEKVLRFIEKLEEKDDVQKIYSNIDI